MDTRQRPEIQGKSSFTKKGGAMYSFEEIEKEDPEIAGVIRDEISRQQSHLELIASENWVSKACKEDIPETERDG